MRSIGLLMYVEMAASSGMDDAAFVVRECRRCHVCSAHMGVYLVSASTWYLEEGSGWSAVLEALVGELAKRGIGAPLVIPESRILPRGSGQEFEEKLIPSIDGFSALCASELGEEVSAVFDWDLLVPADFVGMIELPLRSSYSHTTTVRSAQRMLPAAKRLAVALELPADMPVHCDNLQLTKYFMDREDGGSGKPASVGRWRDDLGTSFYAAMYLRAAEHSIGLNCPMLYT